MPLVFLFFITNQTTSRESAAVSVFSSGYESTAFERHVDRIIHKQALQLSFLNSSSTRHAVKKKSTSVLHCIDRKITVERDLSVHQVWAGPARLLACGPPGCDANCIDCSTGEKRSCLVVRYLVILSYSDYEMRRQSASNLRDVIAFALEYMQNTPPRWNQIFEIERN